jgi:hypothetical protein
MNHHRTLHRSTTLAFCGLAALAALAIPTGSANASRLPADPLTYVGTPAPMARFVLAAQADHVWAALMDVHGG